MDPDDSTLNRRQKTLNMRLSYRGGTDKGRCFDKLHASPRNEKLLVFVLQYKPIRDASKKLCLVKSNLLR